MTNETNVLPVAKIISDFLSNVNSGQGISAKLVVALAEMNMFDVAWLKRFHAETGKEKTAFLHSALGEIYDGFADLVDTAKLKAGDLSPRMLDKKADCQKQLKSLENIMREAFFAVSFLHLKDCSKTEVKGSRRIRFIIDGAWNSDLGDTFDGLVTKGKKACGEAGWTKKADESHKASVGTSLASISAELKEVGTDLPSVFIQLCTTLKSAIGVRKLEELSDKERAAFEELEGAIIRTVYGSEDGTVDTKTIAELYNPRPVNGMATKKGKNGVSLSVNAEVNEKAA